MAGIGFRLKKYFTDKDVWKNLKGPLYSIIISSGPWLISVLSVAFISVYAGRDLQNQDIFVLKSIICYTFAFSLILFGVVEMPVTRYLADRLYISDESSFRNVYLMLGALFIVAGSIFGSIFYYFFAWGIVLKLICICFLISVLLIWHSMVFLSAAKNYHHIIGSFILGGLTSVILGLVLGSYLSLIGYILGYTIGQAMIALLLARNVFSEFADYEYVSFEVFNYFKNFKVLIFVGLFYYLGIWIDKILFWFSHVGQHVEGLFYTNLHYDTAMFLAYLTIVPSLAVFLVQVETNFYVKYAYFYRSIENKNNLPFLEQSVDEIIESFRSTLVSLIKLQLFITILCWYFSDAIMGFLSLPSLMEPIFRYGVVGAFLQVLFLIVNIVLLYFKEAKPVLTNYFIFFLSNLVFSAFSIYGGHKFYGLGYLLSCLLTLIVSYCFLLRTLKNLNFMTFMQQPLSNKSFSESL
jgi:uncharacterized membrane protein